MGSEAETLHKADPITAPGMAVGTVAYMSPEQVRGEELDARTDLFSFGVVLYEMATGVRPFEGATSGLVFEAILNRAPVSPVSLKPGLPKELEHIVNKALEKDRAERYQHADEIRADLRRLRHTGESHSTAAVAATRPARRGMWIALATTAAAAILVLAGLWMWRGRVESPPARSKAIAVLHFRNLSQDNALDWLNSGLCEMLTTNLSQVKGIDVLSTERIAAVLQRMGKKEMNAGLAPEVARDAGAAIFVTGALMRVGTERLRLDVRVQDATGGQVLFSDKAEGDNLDAVLKMVDAVTARMAERLLPSGSLAGKAPALEEVATSNIEAYRHYQLGLDAFPRFEHTTWLRESEEAVRLDPQFALAWRQIAFYYNLYGPKSKAHEVWQRLAGMESRLPRRIQLSLAGVRAMTGADWAGAGRTYETLLAEFPRENQARNWLIGCLWRRDRFDRSAEVSQEGLKLDPNDLDQWNGLSFDQIGMGNLAAALEANDRFRALLPGDPGPPASRGDLYFIIGHDEEAIVEYRKSLRLNATAMGYYSSLLLAFVYADQKQFALAESTLREYGRQSKDPLMRFYEAQLDEARGRPEAARDFYRKAVAEQAKANRYEPAGQALLAFAHVSQVLGEGAAALGFASAQKLEGQEFPAISFLEAVGGGMAAAEVSLQRYAMACPWMTPAGIDIYRVQNQLAITLQRRQLRVPWMPEKWMPLHEARAALAAKDYASAEHLLRRALFLHRWLLTFVGQSHTRSPLVSLLCHIHLGQVYEATGKRGQAADEYREFLSAFEGSASRLPQIPEARAALKRLATP